jgi:hypothetical protein
VKRLEERIERLEYYVDALMKMVDTTKKPFSFLLLKSCTNEKEIEDIKRKCERVNIEYQKQKAEGLLHFDPLLNSFIDEIPSTIRIDDLVTASIIEGYYTDVMTEFKRLLQKRSI